MRFEESVCKVSIIVVNRNGRYLLDNCLQSLCDQNYREREIIVVDNGSTDDSVPYVREYFPHCRVIELRRNTGFAGGSLIGCELARGEFIAIINNDTCAKKDWLANLLRPMAQNAQVGFCSPKILFDSNNTLDSAGCNWTTGGVGVNRGVGCHSENYDISEVVFGASGAAVLYRRQMLDEIGFMDEDFFLYDEDTDLSFRAQLAGWKCVYVPTAIVYHKGSATSGRLSDLHVYYHTRNLEFVWIKNMPAGLMLRFAHHKIIQEIGSFCYLCLRHMKWKPFFRAKRDAWRMLPVMLKKRKQIQQLRRVSNAYLRSLMTSMFSLEMLWQKGRQLLRG